MQMNARIMALASAICLSLPISCAHAATAKSSQGTLVIVFKDGHRQSYHLSDIEKVEFPATSAQAATSTPALDSSLAPSRARFVGKWAVGDGNGRTFIFTLEENGEAWHSSEHLHGRWEYVNGEARISWDNGWHDAIRKSGSDYQKFAYRPGQTFTDPADNITSARNTMPHPI